MWRRPRFFILPIPFPSLSTKFEPSLAKASEGKVEDIGVEPKAFPFFNGTLGLVYLPYTLNVRQARLPILRGEYRSRTDDLLLAKQAL
jgi:hypothetical protein